MAKKQNKKLKKLIKYTEKKGHLAISNQLKEIKEKLFPTKEQILRDKIFAVDPERIKKVIDNHRKTTQPTEPDYPIGFGKSSQQTHY